MDEQAVYQKILYLYDTLSPASQLVVRQFQAKLFLSRRAPQDNAGSPTVVEPVEPLRAQVGDLTGELCEHPSDISREPSRKLSGNSSSDTCISRENCRISRWESSLDPHQSGFFSTLGTVVVVVHPPLQNHPVQESDLTPVQDSDLTPVQESDLIPTSELVNHNLDILRIKPSDTVSECSYVGDITGHSGASYSAAFICRTRPAIVYRRSTECTSKGLGLRSPCGVEGTSTLVPMPDRPPFHFLT